MPNKIKIQILIDDQPIVYNELMTTETFDPFLCKTLVQGLLAQMSSNVGALGEDLGCPCCDISNVRIDTGGSWYCPECKRGRRL